MRHQLLILSKDADRYRQHLEQAALPDLDLTVTEDVVEAADLGGGCELALGEPQLIRRVLDFLPRLRWAQATWAGVEPLLAPGLRRDYVLTNVRAVFGPLITEYVLTYLLMHERRAWARYQAQLRGEWDATPPGTLRGKVLGLAGVGSIGAHLAETARALGLRVWGYTLRSEGCAAVEKYFHGTQMTEFAAGLDYLVSVLPNTPATRRLLNASVLNALPPHALLINVGRGEVLDEDALVAALRRGALAGAVLDVFEQEPLPAGHPLWTTPNVWITGHTAGPSFPAEIAALFVDNYRRWRSGEPLAHRVDFERGY